MSKRLKGVAMLLSGIILSGFLNCPGSGGNGQIRIQWTENLKGDFDFRTRWSYPEGIYRNEFGQLSCDGLCPEGMESMTDTNGRIHADSLAALYRRIDTTHLFHTIQCDAWCYEWAGTDFMVSERIGNGRIVCRTLKNGGTHCSLLLEIANGTCYPRIELAGVAASNPKTYYCRGGTMKIDAISWRRDSVKAEFDFIFNNTDEPDRRMFWKGRIYTAITKSRFRSERL